MNYTFSVLVFEGLQPQTRTMQYESVHVAAFNFSLTLADQDRAWIAVAGLKAFLNNMLYDLLAELEDRGCVYEPPRQVETIMHSIFNPSAKLESDDQNALLIQVDINDYTPKNRRCNFFERISPWLVGITTMGEMLLSTTLGFFWMEYSQGPTGLVPMDAKSNFGVSISSSFLILFWSLWNFFTSGEMIFMKDAGAKMDRRCHQWIDRLRGQAAPVTTVSETFASKGKKIGFALKAFFILGFLNNIYNDITGTYSNLTMTSGLVSDQLSMPLDVYLALNYLQIALDHFDDPVMWSSMIYFNFVIIDALMARYWPAVIDQPPVPHHLNAIESQRLAFVKNRQAIRCEQGQNESAPDYRLLVDQSQQADSDERSLFESKCDDHCLSPRRRGVSPSL